MPDEKQQAQGSELSDQLGHAWEETSEHLKLLETMEAQQLPAKLDQDARDLHRLIREHAWRYKSTEFGDMTLPLVRSLSRLVCAASRGAA